MIRQLASLSILVTLMSLNCFGAKHNIEYVADPYGDEHNIPFEVEELFKAACNVGNITNTIISDKAFVGWSVKMYPMNQPPVLQEEAILYFQVSDTRTNIWIVMCIERVVARGAPGRDVWHRAPSGEGMKWMLYSNNKPSSKELSAFIRGSNFGYNECKSYVQTIQVQIYAPFRDMIESISHRIPETEKQRRFNSASDILH